VRLIKNDFYNQVQKAYEQGLDTDGLRELLGRGRAKKGMFEGDLQEGELEIGQVSAQIDEILTAKEVVESTMKECLDVLQKTNSAYNFE